MDDLVNSIARIQHEIEGAGIMLRLENDRLRLTGPAGSTCLRIVRLYRPSSDDVKREAAPDALLALTAPTGKAVQAAARYNHIVIPGDNYRIVTPGIALIRVVPVPPTEASRQVRLTGRTGVIAESLLLGGRREWSIRDLAADAKVTPALAHRAVVRLEREGLLIHRGSGPTMIRMLSNPRALAELWSQEETMPQPFFRGFLYAPSMEALAQKILEVCPEGAGGGVLAANLYRPVLTRVPPPVRIWVPGDFMPQTLETIGFQPADSGANIELYQTKGDPWRVHRQQDGLPRVSRWRAWREIANAEGRTQELAEAMLSDLE
jgi:hypothetical protein